MALFERDQLPSRSALSRFLTALTEAPIEALRTLLTSRSAQSAPHARQANRKPAVSQRSLLDCLRHRWHAGSGEASRLTSDRRPPPSFSPIGWGLCTWVPGTQARGSGTDKGNGCSGAQLSVARQFRQPREWAISGRTAQGTCGHRPVSDGVSTRSFAHAAAPGRLRARYCCQPFSLSPLPNRTCTFQRIRLSKTAFFSITCSGYPSWMAR